MRSSSEFGVDFFLVGAPKSGTTSLASYLDEHAQIAISSIKEPYFFADDLDGIRQAYGVHSPDRYRDLFPKRKEAVLFGEASTVYLYSESAIPRLLSSYPKARLIALLRNPVDIAYSQFWQMRRHFWEDKKSFLDGWSAQHARRQGDQIPSDCKEPKLLQYRSVASIGSQVARLRAFLDKDQLLLLNFDELKSNPGRLYRRATQFLGLDDDGRTEFPVMNESAQSRSRFVSKLLRSRTAQFLRGELKKLLSKSITQKVSGLQSGIQLQKQKNPELEPQLRKRLQNEFAPEIEQLAQFVDWDCKEWIRD